MSSIPVVSWIMAAHNAQRFIGQAIDSVLAQTLPDFELIVVDDASTDETAAVVRAYDDRRVCYFHLPANVGPAVARNHALAAAHGEFIAILDADDVAMPQRLDRQVAYLREHPQIAGAGTWAHVIDESGLQLGVIEPAGAPALMPWLLLVGCPIVHPSAMIRREVLEKLGGYSAHFRYAQDYDLWQRACAAGYLLSNIRLHLTAYRRSTVQISTARKSDQDAFARKVGKRHAELLLETPVPATVVADLHQLLCYYESNKYVADPYRSVKTLKRLAATCAGRMSPSSQRVVWTELRKGLLGVAADMRFTSPRVTAFLAYTALIAPGGWRDKFVWSMLGSAGKRILQRRLGRPSVVHDR